MMQHRNEEDEDEEEFIFVLTDELKEFFAKSEAKRRSVEGVRCTQLQMPKFSLEHLDGSEALLLQPALPRLMQPNVVGISESKPFHSYLDKPPK
ncbi:hypothetical protein R6Q59_032731 [Mikania micrantha]